MRVIGISALVVFLTLLSVSAVGMRHAWRTMNEPFRGYPESERIVLIDPGQSGRQIIDRLADDGIIRDRLLARLCLRFVLDGESLKAGEYRFDRAMSTLEVLTKLIEARVLTHSVTILEGLTVQETAQHLSDSGFGRLDRFLELVRSPSLIADLDPDAQDLEGYLFPDTYAFASGTTEEAIVGVLVAHARRQLIDHIQPLIEDQPDVTLRQIVILASIVEKEALVDEERRLIAGVYSNRLERGMGLYADPTVIFALKQAGTWDGNIRRADLKIDSPFNTYRYNGLPPGPISSPGRASLEAAARPADVPYLYFVSRNDGTHVFASTLAEHNRNVYIWQKKYWRDRWARER